MPYPGCVGKTEHTPDDNIRLLPMSKKAEEYRKQLEVRDPLEQRLGDIAGEDADYVEMLSHIENCTEFKNLPENSELRLIHASNP